VANIQEQRRKKNLSTFSLKREGSLAQASSFRLGESSKRGTVVLSRSLA